MMLKCWHCEPVASYLYPKIHIACARHHNYFHTEYLLLQCKKAMSLLNVFNCFQLDIHNVVYVLLSSYVVWRNDLLIHAMLFDRFILLEACVNLIVIAMVIKMPLELFLHMLSNYKITHKKENCWICSY